MQRLILAVLLLHSIGCSREFERRKESDLWTLAPNEHATLQHQFRPDNYQPRVTDRTAWLVHTSLDAHTALIDSNRDTSASTAKSTTLGQWILIDLGSLCYFQHVHQLHPSTGGAPPKYRIDTADQRGFPYSLQFVGSGTPAQSSATLPQPVHARFIRITVVEPSTAGWSVSELEVD